MTCLTAKRKEIFKTEDLKKWANDIDTFRPHIDNIGSNEFKEALIRFTAIMEGLLHEVMELREENKDLKWRIGRHVCFAEGHYKRQKLEMERRKQKDLSKSKKRRWYYLWMK